jgi:thiamine-monophosphate kinase
VKDDATRMGPGPEFDAIRALVARWGRHAQGIGDDAAILEVPRGERLVVSVDAFVEDVHFRREWIDARELGYRAATAALSDLAAMAALPLGLLFAIELPDEWIPRLGDLADGVGDAVEAAGTVIIGGNISAGTDLAITTTVLGHAYAPLTRSGARVGDRLYVTGRLGGPAAAIKAWNAGHQPTPEQRRRFAHPSARIREARLLADAGATAAIDISDGLSSELAHLAAASGVSFRVQLEHVPLMDDVTIEEAIRSGEEYELLVAAPPMDADALAARLGCPLTEIGEVTARESGPGGYTMRGQPAFVLAGHNHLS